MHPKPPGRRGKYKGPLKKVAGRQEEAILDDGRRQSFKPGTLRSRKQTVESESVIAKASATSPLTSRVPDDGAIFSQLTDEKEDSSSPPPSVPLTEDRPPHSPRKFAMSEVIDTRPIKALPVSVSGSIDSDSVVVHHSASTSPPHASASVVDTDTPKPKPWTARSSSNESLGTAESSKPKSPESSGKKGGSTPKPSTPSAEVIDKVKKRLTLTPVPVKSKPLPKTPPMKPQSPLQSKGKSKAEATDKSATDATKKAKKKAEQKQQKRDSGIEASLWINAESRKLLERFHRIYPRDSESGESEEVKGEDEAQAEDGEHTTVDKDLEDTASVNSDDLKEIAKDISFSSVTTADATAADILNPTEDSMVMPPMEKKESESATAIGIEQAEVEEREPEPEPEWLRFRCVLSANALKIFGSDSAAESTSRRQTIMAKPQCEFVVFLSTVLSVVRVVKKMKAKKTGTGFDMFGLIVETSPLSCLRLATDSKDVREHWYAHLTRYYLSQHVWRSAPTDYLRRKAGPCVRAVHKSLASRSAAHRLLSSEERAGYRYVEDVLRAVTDLSLKKRLLPRLAQLAEESAADDSRTDAHALEEAVRSGMRLHSLLHCIRYYFMSFVKSIARADEVVLPGTATLSAYVAEVDAILKEADSAGDWRLVSAAVLDYLTQKGHRTLQNLTFALVSSCRDGIKAKTSTSAIVAAKKKKKKEAAASGSSAAAVDYSHYASTVGSSGIGKGKAKESAEMDALRKELSALQHENETLTEAFELHKARLNEYVGAHSVVLSGLRYSQDTREKLAAKISALQKEKEAIDEMHASQMKDSLASVRQMVSDLQPHFETESSDDSEDNAKAKIGAQKLDLIMLKMDLETMKLDASVDTDEIQERIEELQKEIAEAEMAASRRSSADSGEEDEDDDGEVGLVEDQMRLMMDLDLGADSLLDFGLGD